MRDQGDAVSRLISNLGELLSERPLEEKWLIAPSRRIGFQWLDQVTLSGVPVLNVHVKTIQTLALDLAMPLMGERGLGFVRGARAELIAGDAFDRLKRSRGGGYLASLEMSAGLARTLSASLRELRLAGLTSEELRDEDFEVAEKGDEIAALLALYEEGLRQSAMADYAEVLRMAAARLRDDDGAVPQDIVVMMPADSRDDLRGLERSLWMSVPAGRTLVLGTDEPAGPDSDAPQQGTGGRTDLELLRWTKTPADAPAPQSDGTASIFRAVGEVNEVREVLRRCAESGVPFDQVEVIHTDGATYVPLIYELVSSIEACEWEDVPVTFAEGVQVRYSRPARALIGWLSWMREDYPQSVLVRMVQDGLLEVPLRAGERRSFTSLAALLRSVPIGNGRERYAPVLERRLASLEEEAGPGASGRHEDDDAEAVERRREMVFGCMGALSGIKDLVEGLLTGAGGFGTGQAASLDAAAAFVETTARSVNEFDEYARGRLLEEIRELRGLLATGPVPGLDVGDWLMALAGTAQVGGLGPRPGRIHVSPLGAGGHSGRPFTFVLGLDDGRFQGTGRQDPLLIDAERANVASDLRTGRGRLAENVRRFERLLSRLRGHVTLSYSCLALTDDREVFPSPVVLSAYRILSGMREGDLKDLLRWLPEPASFAPAGPGRCIDEAEWWLWRMSGEEAVDNSQELIAASFRNLGRGMEARRARESDRFTEYDGYVPEAGADLDPSRPESRALSASGLERLGSLPMEFFFSHVLGIEVHEEYEVVEARWLDPGQKGELLHDVFHEFMTAACERGLPPSRDRDGDLMRQVLDRHIESWQVDVPPPRRDVFERDVRELDATADIFLREAAGLCEDATPVCFEVAIGMPGEGEATPLDAREPVDIPLADGRNIRVRGRIDRADILAGTGNVYRIIDYKTGSAWGYERSDPFRQGRRMQSLVYVKLFQARLDAVMPGAKVGAFRYFFPGTREHGERFDWSCKDLECGEEILSLLCEMLRTGCFPYTDEAGDARFSDYADAFGDGKDALEAIQRKLLNPSNLSLEPFRRLRSDGGRARGGGSRGRGG